MGLHCACVYVSLTAAEADMWTMCQGGQSKRQLRQFAEDVSCLFPAQLAVEALVK